MTLTELEKDGFKFVKSVHNVNAIAQVQLFLKKNTSIYTAWAFKNNEENFTIPVRLGKIKKKQV